MTKLLRTAATSAPAARRMARPGSRVMALIGNGAQSEFQAIAFHRLVGIRALRLYDTDPQATAKLMRNLSILRLPDLTVTRCASTAEVPCNDADIVTTATADKRNATILTPDMIAPGMHLNAVGGDCPGKTELHADILRLPDMRIVVEFEPQARIEGKFSNWKWALRARSRRRSPSLPMSCAPGVPDVRTIEKLRCSTRWDLRSMISRRCAIFGV